MANIRRHCKPQLQAALGGVEVVMVTLVDRAKDWWKGDAMPQPVKGLMRPIDVDGLATEMSLPIRGADAGAREVPATSATTLDAVEEEVVGKLSAEWTLQRGFLIAMLQAYRDRLAELNAAKVIGELRLSAADAIDKFKSSKQLARGDLARLRSAYIEARNELSEFRAKHRLTRPARDPDGRWATFGLLFVVIAFESVLNGVFFAKGSEAGLIGGVGVAIGISAVNVLLCFFLGAGPARFINWRGWLLKSIGFVVTLGGWSAVALLHFFAAHFRDATVAVGEKEAYAKALSQLWQDPFGFSDITSWYLFGLGLAFGLISFWKGYRFDDPYPYYGETFRREREAHDAYAEEHDEFFEALKEVREETVEAFRAGLANIPQYVAKSEQVRAARTALLEEFKAYETGLQQAGNRLLTIYREACRQHRQTQAPAHFSERWSLPGSAVAGPEITALVAEARDDVVGDVRAVLDELRTLSEEVIKTYGELAAAAEHPSDMK
jgi:hypothetical protein